MNIRILVRKYFPKANNSLIEHIVWSKTGYPSFWSGNGTPLSQFKAQLAKYKRAVKLGRDVCYCCDKIRFKKQMDSMGMCGKGLQIMAKAKLMTEENRKAGDGSRATHRRMGEGANGGE